MLAIRLARTGKKHQAYFRIVVSDSKKQPTAKFVEILGSYDPHAKKLQIDKEKLATYLKNGAQPSNSLAKILKSEKIELPKWVKITEKKKAPKKAEEKKEPVSTEASQGGESKADKSEPSEGEVSAEKNEPTENTKEKSEEPAPAEEKAAEPEGEAKEDKLEENPEKVEPEDKEEAK